jgi:choline dehydrogenase
MQQAMTYDFVIVGAGSAGCVLADRLSADPAKRVLLLEAGGRDWHPFIHMPAGIGKLASNPQHNWNYETEPEPYLDGRRLWWPRGKVLGGSSSINAMCYIRGVKGDYDGWAEKSADARWAWDNVVGYFKRSEHNTRGADARHGAEGPLSVSDLRHRNPLSQVFIDSAVAAGYPRNTDFNGEQQEGFGWYQVTQKNGARCSTAASFLREARSRPNLTVRTHAEVQHVLFSATRAVGVDYRHHGRLKRAEAGEVILAGGAINSPQLLMLSGIGPADHLREHGIGVRQDLEGVGGNLQDHLDICSLTHCTEAITYDKTNDIAIALEFFFKRTGIGTSNIAETGGFLRSRHAEDERCDMQFHFVPAMLDDHGRNKLEGNGYTLHACMLHPKSRGSLRLKSTDPRQAIAIHANYLSDAEGYDLKMLVEATRISHSIFAQSPFDRYRGAEIFPSVDIADDRAVEAFVRRKAETVYHPVGTCRMGTDAAAVVDSELRVRGLDGLRVVDASVMPDLPSGNTNAPTIMIAERASDLILGKS